MEVDMGADGKVTDARVVQSAGAQFDGAALDADAAVRRSRQPRSTVSLQRCVCSIQLRRFFFRQQVVEVPVAPDGGLSGS
jgi:uncharacterized protein YijF (DUF1287 family)